MNRRLDGKRAFSVRATSGATACALVLAFAPPSTAAAKAATGIPDPGLSTAASQAGTVMISPSGHGQTLAQVGCTVTVVVRDANGQPIAGFPFQDIWLESAITGEIVLCPGGVSADTDTDATGHTTISGTLVGGGFTQGGLLVVLAGAPILASPLSIQVNSPDITGDTRVNLSDVSPFSSDLGGTYHFRSDLFPDGRINLADVGLFSASLGASCP